MCTEDMVVLRAREGFCWVDDLVVRDDRGVWEVLFLFTGVRVAREVGVLSFREGLD